MKKKYITICLLLKFLFVFGQEHNKESQNYYSTLYKAQSYLVENKFDSASSVYNNLLQLYQTKSNVIDIYNALILNFLNSNKKQVRFCLKLFSSKNISIKRLFTIKAIDSLHKISSNFIRSKEIRKYDMTYRVYPWLKALDSVYQIDQKPRLNRENYTTTEGKRAIYLVDSANTTFLKNYVDKYGFNDYEDVLHDTINNLSKLEIMIIHQTALKQSQFIPVIEKGVDKLQIKPGIAYYLIDLFKGVSKHETVAIFQLEVTSQDSICENQYNSKWLSFDYNQEILNKINGVREKDLLEEWNSYIKKSFFALKNPLFNWHIPFAVSKFNFDNCLGLKSFLDNPRLKLKIAD